MRRALALLLLGLFSFSLSSPFLLADQPELPACCRRDGKHRCAMADMAAQSDSTQGAGVQAILAKCPLYPKAGTVAIILDLSATATLVQLHAPDLTSNNLVKARTRHSANSKFGATYKRGPPPCLS